jgi:hypothetical protein
MMPQVRGKKNSQKTISNFLSDMRLYAGEQDHVLVFLHAEAAGIDRQWPRFGPQGEHFSRVLEVEFSPLGGGVMRLFM